ncbi:MAG: ABC transporter permease [Acidobacteriia bacterium]|nr:ABC transporter permease [Terriglobia bacterium]
MQIRLLAGREFETQDSKPEAPAAIVNMAFAKRYFSGESPLGKELMIKDAGVPVPHQLEVVGLVADAKYNNLREAAVPTVYAPLRRITGVTLEVRSAASPLALKPELSQAVRRVHPSLKINDVTLQSARIDSTLLGERLLAMLSGFFGMVALVLAFIGLYGVLSYAVVRRTKEIGIRIALGARQLAVVHLVINDILLTAAIGLAAGMAGGVALARLVKAVLFEVRPSDVGSLALPLACLLLSSVLAAAPPAWRAVRVDPMVALRYE